MKWFKHHSDNYRGQTIAEIHREFGHSGVAWLYLLNEICAEKVERNKEKKPEKEDMVFVFDKTFVESSLRGTFAKIERWLGHGAVMALWSYTTTERTLRLEYPNLLKLLDSDLLKTRRSPDAVPTQYRLEREREREREVVRKNSQEELPCAVEQKKPEAVDIWNAHRGTFPKVLSVNNGRRRKCEILLKSFSSEQVIEALAKANQSKFLTGQTGRGWKMDFDFFIKDGTIAKILEGSYDDVKTEQPSYKSKLMPKKDLL